MPNATKLADGHIVVADTDEIGEDYILGRVTDELGVEYVQVWPLERSGG